MTADELFMAEALALARLAQAAGEVPVGAVVVLNNEIIGRGFNQPISSHDPTAHAEILALRQASAAISNYRLENATLFSSLEPCVMCAGALLHARIHRLVFAARDLRFGAIRSKFQLANHPLLNHHLSVSEGPLAPESTALLQSFFLARR